MRLIDADELLNDLIFPTKQFKKAFTELINDASTIEAEPIKHGKPIVYYHGENTFSYECGICHMPIDGKDYYCKWCGARMDGGKND